MSSINTTWVISASRNAGIGLSFEFNSLLSYVIILSKLDINIHGPINITYFLANINQTTISC